MGELKEEVDSIIDGEIVNNIVRTMQTHLESGPVLEMACGALRSLLDGSEDRKKRMIESGGIDTVTCVIVMHPNEPSTLERACGVLASISVSPPNASAIADAQGVGNIVEAMRSNSSSITLLEFGALVLRNIILSRPDYTAEASNVVTCLISQMKKNPDAVSFQRESCCLLWAMAALSEHCKEKILSLDGFSVIVSCLEFNSSFPDVQDAALGAFNQLAR